MKISPAHHHLAASFAIYQPEDIITIKAEKAYEEDTNYVPSVNYWGHLHMFSLLIQIQL